MLYKAHLAYAHSLFKFIYHPGWLSYSLCSSVQWLAFSSSNDIPLLISSIPAHSSCRNRCGSCPVCSPTLLKYRSPWNLLCLILHSFSFHSPPLLDSVKSMLTASRGPSCTDDGNHSQTPSLPDRSWFGRSCWREKREKILSTQRPKKHYSGGGGVGSGSRVSSINSWEKGSNEELHTKVCIQLFIPVKQWESRTGGQEISKCIKSSPDPCPWTVIENWFPGLGWKWRNTVQAIRKVHAQLLLC